MNGATRFAIVIGCFLLCAGGIVTSSRVQAKIDNDNAQLNGWDPVGEYLYAASDAPLKLSLNEIESIIRRDPTTKSQHGKMEFGSVKVEHGAVVAQVLFVNSDGGMQAFLYELKRQNHSWKVATAQRLWFVPRSRLLRGVRV